MGKLATVFCIPEDATVSEPIHMSRLPLAKYHRNNVYYLG